MQPSQIAIIGAGMAGLSCAQALGRMGHAVRLFDKGRGPGGRMATRRIATDLGDASFDHGAQYLTARDPAFVTQVETWRAAGVVAPWPAAGVEAWVGRPAMNAPIKAMAGSQDVMWNVRVEEIVRGDHWHLRGDGVDTGPFDAIVLAVPAEQVSALLVHCSPAMAARAVAIRSTPCWTVMAAFAERLAIDDIVRDAGLIAWAARNSAKPGRAGPESWVIQAGPHWSLAHLERPADEIAATLLASLREHIGETLPAPIVLTAHRWRYARSGALGEDCLWDDALGLGACGDWLLGPRVENAWLSGLRLAQAICGQGHRVA